MASSLDQAAERIRPQSRKTGLLVLLGPHFRRQVVFPRIMLMQLIVQIPPRRPIADTVPSSSLRTGAPSKSNVETCYLLTRGVGPGESSACTVKCHRAHIASMSGGRCLELSGPTGDLVLPLTSIEMCQVSKVNGLLGIITDNTV